MGQTRIALLLALGATLMGANAANEGEAPKTKAEASATVTVTAEASPVELVKTPNPVTVVTTEKLETIGASNLSDLLQAVFPGQVSRTGGIGSTSSFMLGGARPQDVAVMVDGIRVNDASGLVGANASLVNLVGIDRAEIQQGPCSARFGSSAMGGTVALYSAGSTKDGFSGDFRLKGGTQGIVGTTFAPAYSWGSGWVRTSVDLQQQDSNLESQLDYRSTGIFLGGGQQIDNWGLATLSYRNAYTGTPVPIVYASIGTSRYPDSYYDETRETRSRDQVLSASLQAVILPTLKGSVTLGGHELNRWEPGMYTGAAPVPFLSRNKQATGNLTWDPTRIFSLNVSMEALDSLAKAPDLDGTATLVGKDKHFATTTDVQVEIASILRLVGSVRWEHDTQNVPIDSDGNSIERASSQYTGKGGFNLLLPAGFRIYGSAGWGFSNPQLYHSIFNARYGGEALENEKSKFVQAGASYEQGPWKAKLELSRTLFSSLVYYDGNGGVPVESWGGWLSGIYLNGRGIRIQSAQISGGYESKHCGLTGFYRNQEARDTGAAEGQQLSSSAVLRRPFQSLGLATYCVVGDVRLDARWSWTGSQYEAGGSDPVTYAYTPNFAYRTHYNDLSLSAAWAVQKNLTFILRGDNLMQPHANKEAWMSRVNDFRNDASQVYGYPAQSPSATAELRYRF
ncbi:MAG: TonB-dependent receptor, plug [Holophagaceae bacterium]|nr:TonB-dependent receptor, plug [Holophagaceae bacterium]